ncbi:hypothetical protein CR513_32015, partial [Mucuna pruriens]
MIRINNVPIDAICLRLFSFFLADKEPIGNALERFQEMLRICPYHDFLKGQLIQIFYNGLSILNKTSINIACGGTIRKKHPGEA